jgi:hypothetical protein
LSGVNRFVGHRAAGRLPAGEIIVTVRSAMIRGDNLG